MNIGERRGRLCWTVVAAVVGTVIGVTGCRPTPTAASGGSVRPAVTATVYGAERVHGMTGSAVSPPPRPAAWTPRGR